MDKADATPSDRSLSRSAATRLDKQVKVTRYEDECRGGPSFFFAYDDSHPLRHKAVELRT